MTLAAAPAFPGPFSQGLGSFTLGLQMMFPENIGVCSPLGPKGRLGLVER